MTFDPTLDIARPAKPVMRLVPRPGPSREEALRNLDAAVKALDAEVEQLRLKRLRLTDTVLKLATGAVSPGEALEVLR